jgi:hypothetical protein
VLLHGDSINFTAARVSDKPGRIRITSAHFTDYKTAEPGDKLAVRYNASHQIELGHGAAQTNICYGPKADMVLFDHFISAGEQRRWHS